MKTLQLRSKVSNREVRNLEAILCIGLAFIATWSAYTYLSSTNWIDITLGFVAVALTLPCYFCFARSVYLATTFPKQEVTLLRRFTGWALQSKFTIYPFTALTIACGVITMGYVRIFALGQTDLYFQSTHDFVVTLAVGLFGFLTNLFLMVYDIKKIVADYRAKEVCAG